LLVGLATFVPSLELSFGGKGCFQASRDHACGVIPMFFAVATPPGLMRLAVDTNVLVAGILSASGPPGWIVEALLSARKRGQA
jgi:hypothetical protein